VTTGIDTVDVVVFALLAVSSACLYRYAKALKKSGKDVL